MAEISKGRIIALAISVGLGKFFYLISILNKFAYKFEYLKNTLKMKFRSQQG